LNTKVSDHNSVHRGKRLKSYHRQDFKRRNKVVDIKVQSTELIDQQVSLFLEQIRKDCSKGNKAIKEASDYPIFQLANDDYFKLKGHEDYLEWQFRDYLITGVIAGLLEIIKGVSNIKYFSDYAENAVHINKYANTEFGNAHLFPFLIYKGEKVTAYRYSDFDTIRPSGDVLSDIFENNNLLNKFSFSLFIDDEILDLIIKKYEIDEIKIIDWKNKDHTERRSFRSKDLPITYITIKDLFVELFNEEIFNYYWDKVTNAVSEANAEIGLNVISSLTTTYVSDFKNETAEVLKKFPYETAKYINFDNRTGEPNGTFLSLSAFDKKIIYDQFIGEKHYLTMISDAEYAKCFITSEHLYEVFKKERNNHFDYSGIVLGYVKSIELLLEFLMEQTLHHDNHENLFIMTSARFKNEDDDHIHSYRNRDKNHIRFKNIYRRKFKIEMMPLANFVCDNYSNWRINDFEILRQMLENYSQGCRNDHLHKDPVKDMKIVSDIRSNTIFLISALMAGYKITRDQTNDRRVLMINNAENSYKYNLIYNTIIRLSKGGYFDLQFKGEIIKTVLLFNQDPHYNNNNNPGGYPDLKFLRINDYTREEYMRVQDNYTEKELIKISTDNLPEKIIYRQIKNQYQVVYDEKEL